MSTKQLSCEKFAELIVDYLDGGRTPEIDHQCEEHMEVCPRCGEFLDAYCQTGEVCRKALNVEMPQPAKSSLFEYLRTELNTPEEP